MHYSGKVDDGARLVDYVRIQDPIESVAPFHGTWPDANLLLTRYMSGWVYCADAVSIDAVGSRCTCLVSSRTGGWSSTFVPLLASSGCDVSLFRYLSQT